MHCRYFCLLLIATAGCNPAEEERRRAVRAELQKISEAVQQYQQVSQSISASAPSDVESTNHGDLTLIVGSSNEFACDLYQQLATQQGNLFFSPVSLSTALAMTSAGAAGKTKKEMVATLNTESADQIHDGMQSLLASLPADNETDEIRLSLANRLWGQEETAFLPEFLHITRERYGAELMGLDFAQTELSRQTINGWIEDQTNGEITELLTSGVITPNTRLVLTNAVYFHGAWLDPFQKDGTVDDNFYATMDKPIRVLTMHQSGEFRYGQAEDVQLLELPYGRGELSMIILLPMKYDGLHNLQERLTIENLQRWTGRMKREEEVRVSLPRFKATSRFRLKETLQALGMPSAFAIETANFSGMTGSKDLFISAVIHQASIDVNEEGTEATAASAVVMATPSGPLAKQPLVFRADHPFIFLIKDNTSGAILFFGRIVNPGPSS